MATIRIIQTIRISVRRMISYMCKFPKYILVLLEPTAACNMRCLHCYHADTGYDTQIMSIKTLDGFLRTLMPNYKNVKIIWHGGEPLIAGYEFYKKAYELFEKYSSEFGCKFSFNIQTNGTLLTEDLINLFRASNTTISISYDGQFNSILRQQTERVEETINKLQKQGIHFSCLSTISSKSVAHLLDLYEYFKQKNIPVKFNHIFTDGAARKHDDFSVSQETWTSNFIQLFNFWLYDTNCNIRLSSCLDLLHQYFGVRAGCLNHSCLFRYIAVDARGDIYPCGRLIKDEFKLANVHDIDDVRETFLSDTYLRILKDNKARIEGCQHCKWFDKCHGGCSASCLLAGSLQKKNEFECYFTKKIFDNIEKQLCNIKIKHLNSYAQKIIEENLS